MRERIKGKMLVPGTRVTSSLATSSSFTVRRRPGSSRSSSCRSSRRGGRQGDTRLLGAEASPTPPHHVERGARAGTHHRAVHARWVRALLQGLRTHRNTPQGVPMRGSVLHPTEYHCQSNMPSCLSTFSSHF